jgi:hypothetical protein
MRMARTPWCLPGFAEELGAFYDARGLARSQSRKKIPYQIAQNLSSRLGIAAGHIRPPGPLDDLEEMVLFKFGSLRAFCKATGIPDKELDCFLAGRGDLSLNTLLKALETIGYRLRITPAAPAVKAKQARAGRGKRTARPA